MPRTKSTTTTSTDTMVEVDTEKNTKEKEVKEEIVKTETKSSKKEKEISDDADVKIKCISLANKSVIVGETKYQFDENGIGIVPGKIAKKLITIPGYELA